MKARAARIVVRVIGTLIALIGLTMLGTALLVLTTAPAGQDRAVLSVMLLFPLLLFAAWFIYVGYSAWSKLSPTVVRHVFALLILLCFFSISKRIVPGLPADPDSPWRLAALIGLFLAACAIQRVVSKQFNHWLFPEIG
jgi:hypothetical protein